MRVSAVTVTPERIEATLVFDAAEPMRTSDIPGLVTSLLRVLPGLRGHRCDTPGARTFSDELPDTEIAHLVEHATLEIAALTGSPDTLRGETSWDFARDGRGVFHVSLDYDDDLVVLGSLTCAVGVVGEAVHGREPDVAAEVERLRGVRRAG